MSTWDFARSISGVRLLIELGTAHGLPAKKCLLGTGIREQDLGDPNCVVSAEQELRLIRNLMANLQQVPALGIEAGLRYHYSTFGTLGFAIVTSQNLRKALEIALRYFNLTYAFTQFEVSDTEYETRIVIDGSQVPEDARRFIVERDAAALVAVQREVTSVADALRCVDFQFPTPKDVSPYLGAFDIAPNFGARQTVVAFDRKKMLLPLPQANDLVLKFCEEQCVQLLERYGSRVGLAAKVRGLLAANTEIDMESVAKALCMTSRTLRRQLANEEDGTSFTAIRDEVRIALAEEYLVVLKLSVDETAYRLGYLSSSAFITAFRRITGETPLAFRKRLEREERQEASAR